jgi:hypothetical protein
MTYRTKKFARQTVSRSRAAEASFGEEKAVAPFDFAQSESYRTPEAACGCEDDRLNAIEISDFRFEMESKAKPLKP